jgi:hypothetical protein
MLATVLLALATVLLALTPGASRAQSPKDSLRSPEGSRPSSRYHVVGPQRPLAPGERVELRLVPAPPEGTRVDWSCALVSAPPPASENRIGRGLAVSYLAPFVVHRRATVRVTAAIAAEPFRELASLELELLGGSIAGVADCLGPSQTFLEDRGGISPEYTFVDELPEAIRRVDPVTPSFVVARGIADTVALSVLVCQTGRVIAAIDLQRFARPADPLPLATDPRLVQAAIQAVLQWKFRPARAAGTPVATWVTVPFRFGP